MSRLLLTLLLIVGSVDLAHADYATGSVRFGTYSVYTNPHLIPPGITVQTKGGTIRYKTVADPTQPTWSENQNAYVLAPGEKSLTATVRAVIPGASSNVAANQLRQIATPLPGIDIVTNPLPISNGIGPDPEVPRSNDAHALAADATYVRNVASAYQTRAMISGLSGG